MVYLVILSILLILCLVYFLIKKINKKYKKLNFFENFFIYLIIFFLIILLTVALVQILSFLSNGNINIISLAALVISLLSLFYNFIFFNGKIKITKELKETIPFLKIENLSNKDIKITSIKINNVKLINEYNHEQGGKKVILQTIDGIQYVMFKYEKFIKMNCGSHIKIQYSRNENCKTFEVLNVKLECNYKTLFFNMKKTIETDLSPYV